jgi:hypothetical protein
MTRSTCVPVPLESVDGPALEAERVDPERHMLPPRKSLTPRRGEPPTFRRVRLVCPTSRSPLGVSYTYWPMGGPVSTSISTLEIGHGFPTLKSTVVFLHRRSVGVGFGRELLWGVCNRPAQREDVAMTNHHSGPNTAEEIYSIVPVLAGFSADDITAERDHAADTAEYNLPCQIRAPVRPPRRPRRSRRDRADDSKHDAVGGGKYQPEDIPA